jgi:hypothetical protein
LKFYTEIGEVVLQTGFNWEGIGNYETHTVLLAVGERVIGYKSRNDLYFPNYAWHYYF